MSKLLRILKYGFLSLLFAFLLSSLLSAGRKAGATVSTSNPWGFNPDSAYAYISRQVAFGPRVPNTPAHAACARYLTDRLQAVGWSPVVQRGTVTAYDGSSLEISNIFAQFQPEKSQRILLMAHWDSRPFADKDSVDQMKPIPGANDGASGVGVLLEITRVLATQSRRPYVGIDILLLDAEDYGKPASPGDTLFAAETWCLGARQWAAQVDTTQYRPMYGILLDMVGAQDAVFTRESTSMKQGAFVMNRVWRIAASLGYEQYFSTKETRFVGIDDHIVVYKETGIPCIDIIHYDARTPMGFFDRHHTHRDNLAGIHKPTLRAVGETLLELVYTQY